MDDGFKILNDEEVHRSELVEILRAEIQWLVLNNYRPEPRFEKLERAIGKLVGGRERVYLPGTPEEQDLHEKALKEARDFQEAQRENR